MRRTGLIFISYSGLLFNLLLGKTDPKSLSDALFFFHSSKEFVNDFNNPQIQIARQDFSPEVVRHMNQIIALQVLVAEHERRAIWRDEKNDGILLNSILIHNGWNGIDADIAVYGTDPELAKAILNANERLLVPIYRVF
jgi:hypothetical protein